MEKTDIKEVVEEVEKETEDVTESADVTEAEVEESEETTEDEPGNPIGIDEDFDFTEDDLYEPDEPEDEPEEESEETEETEETEEEENDEKPDYESILAQKDAAHKALLKELGFESDDEAHAYAKGQTVEEYRAERAKQVETFRAWEQEDINEIVKAYPELKGKKLKDVLDDPQRFASLRGDTQLRAKMSAVDAFEFVNRKSIYKKAEQAGARQTASKAHLQSTKTKNVKAKTEAPRYIHSLLGDEIPREEADKLYREIERS